MSMEVAGSRRRGDPVAFRVKMRYTRRMDRSAAVTPRSGTSFAVFASCIAACGGFLAGYDLAIIGSASTFLRAQFRLTDGAMGAAMASVIVGCLFGPLLGMRLSEAIGREKTMAIAAFSLCIGAVGTAAAGTIGVFNLFRAVGGLGVGFCSVACPMYIAETAPARIRGSLGLLYQIAVVAGSAAAALAAFLILRVFPAAAAWRWMFLSQTVLIAPFLCLLLLLPPSPRWLAGRGRHEEALAVLRRFDSEDGARRELEGIRGAASQRTGSLRDLLGSDVRPVLLVGLLLAFFNNGTGWSVMGGYIPMLLQMAGVDQGRSLLGFALTYGVMGIVNLLAVVPVERIGRRPLWMAGSAAMALVTAAAGFVFHFHAGGPFVLLVLALCAVPHGFALGPLPWLMISEIFPSRIRAAAVAAVTTFLWAVILAGAQVFPMITGWSERTMGSGAAAFWLFAVVCMLSLLFGWKMLPETRGRTLERIGGNGKA